MTDINTTFEPLMNVEAAAQTLCLHPKTLMKMAREHRISGVSRRAVLAF